MYVIQTHFPLKYEVEKLNEQIKGRNGVNNLQAEVDKLDVGKMKTGPKDFKRLSDVMDREIVKKTDKNNKYESK